MRSVPSRPLLPFRLNPAMEAHAAPIPPVYKADTPASPPPNPVYMSSKTCGHTSSRWDLSLAPDKACISVSVSAAAMLALRGRKGRTGVGWWWWRGEACVLCGRFGGGMRLLLFHLCRRGDLGLGGLVGRPQRHPRALRLDLPLGGMWLWCYERADMPEQPFEGRVAHPGLHIPRAARRARGVWRICSEG